MIKNWSVGQLYNTLWCDKLGIHIVSFFFLLYGLFNCGKGLNCDMAVTSSETTWYYFKGNIGNFSVYKHCVCKQICLKTESNSTSPPLYWLIMKLLETAVLWLAKTLPHPTQPPSPHTLALPFPEPDKCFVFMICWQQQSSGLSAGRSKCLSLGQGCRTHFGVGATLDQMWLHWGRSTTAQPVADYRHASACFRGTQQPLILHSISQKWYLLRIAIDSY